VDRDRCDKCPGGVCHVDRYRWTVQPQFRPRYPPGHSRFWAGVSSGPFPVLLAMWFAPARPPELEIWGYSSAGADDIVPRRDLKWGRERGTSCRQSIPKNTRSCGNTWAGPSAPRRRRKRKRTPLNARPLRHGEGHRLGAQPRSALPTFETPDRRGAAIGRRPFVVSSCGGGFDPLCYLAVHPLFQSTLLAGPCVRRFDPLCNSTSMCRRARVGVSRATGALHVATGDMRL